MLITRRQFGLALLGGLAMLLFGKFLGWFGRGGGAAAGPARARYWKSADHLAG